MNSDKVEKISPGDSDAAKESASLLASDGATEEGRKGQSLQVAGQQQQKPTSVIPIQAWPRLDSEVDVPPPPSSPLPSLHRYNSSDDLCPGDGGHFCSSKTTSALLRPPSPVGRLDVSVFHQHLGCNGLKGHLVVTKRRCYTKARLERNYGLINVSPSLDDVIKEECRRCSVGCVGNKLLSFLPIVGVLRTYRWNRNAIGDIICGLSVGFLHLPQGLGFGLLASLTPVHGLYSSFFPVLVYMVFGTSPHVSMGTNAVVALLAANVVNGEVIRFQSSKGDNETISEAELIDFKVGIAGACCFIGGFILIAMGLLRLGFVTNFMAKSFIGGFSFAAAVHITMSQIVKLFHLKLPSRSGMGKLVFTTIDIGRNIGDTNIADVIVGVISAVVLLGVNTGVNERYKKRLKIPVPIELIVVVGSTFISHFAQLKDRFNVDVVGDIPQGMPAPTVPPLDVIPNIAANSFVTAILIFALTISMGKLTAKLHDIQIDDNQELVAYGMCQVVGSFFHNFSSSISPPRTMMLSSMGSKSTLNGFTSALFILLILLAAGQLFVSLPIAMLAAMIVAAMKDLLMQVTVLRSLWYINKSDFFIWLTTAVVSIFGDLDIGLLVGVVVSMVTVMLVSQSAKGTLLGKSDTEDLILDLERKGVSGLPGVRIFRFESQLHFASAERFKSEMYSKICDPTLTSRKDCYEIDISLDMTSDLQRNHIDVTPAAAGEHETREKKAVSVEMSLRSGAKLQYKFQGTPSDDNDGGESEGTKDEEVGRGGEVEAGGGAKPEGQKRESRDTKPEPRRESRPVLTFTDERGTRARKTSMDNVSVSSNFSLTKKPMPANQLSDLNYVIVDCSTMTYIDITGVDMLHLIITQFSRAGVAVLLTDIPTTTLAILTRAKFFQHEDNRRVYHSVLDALHAIRTLRNEREHMGIIKSFGDFTEETVEFGGDEKVEVVLTH